MHEDLWNEEQSDNVLILNSTDGGGGAIIILYYTIVIYEELTIQFVLERSVHLKHGVLQISIFLYKILN